MSQTNDQLQQLEELDARVDALVEDIHASSAAVQSGVAEAASAERSSASVVAHEDVDDDADDVPEPSAIDPALATPPRTPFTFDESDFSSAQSVLEEVSGEIEHAAPGSAANRAEEPVAPVLAPVVTAPAAQPKDAAAPPIQPAPQSPPRSETPRADGPAVMDESHASEHSSLDAALADAAEELASAPVSAQPPMPAAAPAAHTPEPDARAPQAAQKPASLKDHMAMAAAAASAEHPHDEPEHDATPAPVADREQLDQALAANADKALEDAQRELDQHAATVAATPEPEPAAPLAETPAPTDVAASPAPAPAPPAPAAKSTPTPAPAPQPPLVEILPTEPKRSKVAVLSAALLAPLRPIAALHEKFGESTRQTIGYIAVMNVFFASVVWFFALQKPVTRDPVSMGAHAFHSDEEAATAKAAHAAAHAADAHGAEHKTDGHGASGSDSDHGSGHGEKKPEAKKSSSGHGSDSDHGAKKPEAKKADAKKAETKKTAAKTTKKKSDAKADAHGGH